MPTLTTIRNAMSWILAAHPWLVKPLFGLTIGHWLLCFYRTATAESPHVTIAWFLSCMVTGFFFWGVLIEAIPRIPVLMLMNPGVFSTQQLQWALTQVQKPNIYPYLCETFADIPELIRDTTARMEQAKPVVAALPVTQP